MKRHRLSKASHIVALIGCMACGGGAQAKPGETAKAAIAPALPTSRLAGAFQAMLLSQNQCINYAYDKNGNRMSQSNSAFVNTHPVWGTDSYLCFAWSAN